MNDLSLHIIDLIQNSLSAGAARIRLSVREDTESDKLTITIRDNGKGIAPEQLHRLSDPFFTSRTTRRVGMGIPLLRQSAEQAGGGITIESTPGQGTTITAVFQHSHIDRPPLGNLANSFILMVSANPDTVFDFCYAYNRKEYRLNTPDIADALEGMPLHEPAVVGMLTEMVEENIRELKL